MSFYCLVFFAWGEKREVCWLPKPNSDWFVCLGLDCLRSDRFRWIITSSPFGIRIKAIRICRNQTPVTDTGICSEQRAGKESSLNLQILHLDLIIVSYIGPLYSRKNNILISMLYKTLYVERSVQSSSYDFGDFAGEIIHNMYNSSQWRSTWHLLIKWYLQ